MRKETPGAFFHESTNEAIGIIAIDVVCGGVAARLTKFEFIELEGNSLATQRFRFEIEPAWNRKKLRLAVFVQDKRTGSVHQAADVPWASTTAVETSATAPPGPARTAR
jgi:hypothetical protein